MGLPGAGKSTVARSLAAEGYERLNRDEAGGSLKSLLPALDTSIDRGATRIVLDNTYVSRKQRAPVVQAAAERGFATRCLWLATSVEDAQVNAVSRIVSRYGRLLTPEEMREAVKRTSARLVPVCSSAINAISSRQIPRKGSRLSRRVPSRVCRTPRRRIAPC